MSDIQINFDGKAYDLDEFELGDLEWLEEHLGASLSDVDALSSMKAAVAFVYLIRKRDNPEFTLDDARKTKLSVLAAGDEPEPEAPAKKRPPKRAAR